MTPERLKEIRKRFAAIRKCCDLDARCGEHPCYCHLVLNEVLAELDKLRAALTRVTETAEDAALAGWERTGPTEAALAHRQAVREAAAVLEATQGASQ